ncbi:MAG: membrane protein insertase YidC [Clostridia bacterium]|nr:membrane protein insertase YidC [Clostridia bacterium]MBQ8522257.1 membrane protein insertase YidC [Clostridia bacterium]
MGMLNFSQMLITKAFWGKCIDLFVKWVGNYGWAIILLTIAIKLILTPLDIMQKRVNAKNAKMQAIMQPELQKVQQQYPGDRNKLNQKQMELAKKYNFNMTGTCLTLLISMIVTLVVFTSLFMGINSLSKKQENIAFNEIYQTYITAEEYTQNNSQEFLNESLEVDQSKVDAYIANEVNAKFKKQSKKYSFMWVKNVWKGDTTTSPVVNYSSFEKYAINNGIIDDSEKAQLKEDYNIIKSIIEEDNKNNGYYLLIILAGVITFLVQFLQVKLQEKKTGVKNPSSKIMLIIMPIFMIIFASTSSALFTLYIITNSIMSALISTITDLFMPKNNKPDDKVVYKKGNTEVVEYSRNYNKG